MFTFLLNTNHPELTGELTPHKNVNYTYFHTLFIFFIKNNPHEFTGELIYIYNTTTLFLDKIYTNQLTSWLVHGITNVSKYFIVPFNIYKWLKNTWLTRNLKINPDFQNYDKSDNIYQLSWLWYNSTVFKDLPPSIGDLTVAITVLLATQRGDH